MPDVIPDAVATESDKEQDTCYVIRPGNGAGLFSEEIKKQK